MGKMEKSEKYLSLGLFFLRALMGMGIAYHGYDIIFGGHMSGLTQGVAKMGFPTPVFFAWAAALSEFLGGIFIAMGLYTRLAAFFVFITMSVAAFITHENDPFNVKELALAYWAVAGMFVLAGGGKFSLDALFCRRR